MELEKFLKEEKLEKVFEEAYKNEHKKPVDFERLTIISAFNWEKSAQKHRFWSDINKKYIKFLKNINN